HAPTARGGCANAAATNGQGPDRDGGRRTPAARRARARPARSVSYNPRLRWKFSYMKHSLAAIFALILGWSLGACGLLKDVDDTKGWSAAKLYAEAKSNL